jgi:mannitol/fructose-specific phosphotransferase system IIA component (Ntr-type)
LDGVGRFPLAGRRRKLLDDLDAAAKGAFPVRVDACRALRILPRVRDDGTLDSVTVLNLSIGETDEIEVRVRNPAAGRAFWQDAKLSTPVPLALRPGASANERIVKIASLAGWQIGTIFFETPDPYEYKELVAREAIASTAVGEGAAFLHPRFHDPYMFEDTFIAYGRSERPVFFGAADGQGTRHFFLVCSTDHETHLHILARLAVMAHATDFLARLDEAASAEEVIAAIREAEEGIV